MRGAVDKRLMAQTTFNESEFIPRVRRKRSSGRRRDRLRLLALMLLGACAVAMASVGLPDIRLGLSRSEAHEASVAYVAQHGRVKQELGEPVEGGLFWTEAFSRDTEERKSRLRFEVCGSKGCGDVSVAAQKLGGEWHVVDAVLTLNGKAYDIGPG